MANILANYNPEFFATEALMHLSTRKGFAQRVYRGAEADRRAAGASLGEFVNFRKPSSFQTAAIGSAASDIRSESVQLQLDNHKQVRFTVSDQELTFGGERLIREHIIPAADALANDIDVSIAQEFQKVPHFLGFDATSATGPVDSLVAVRKMMVENKVPADGKPRHYMASPTTMADLLAAPQFAEWQGAGAQGVGLQGDGLLDQTKYGFSFYESTNVQARTATASTLDADPVIDGDMAFGAKSLTVDGTASGALPAGAVVRIGNYKYVVASAFAGGATTLVLESGLREPVLNDVVVEVLALPSELTNGQSYAEDLAFHENSMALVVAALPMHGADMGARVYSAIDPESGMSLRARLSYDNVNAQVEVIMDALWGVKLIDGDLAVRVGIDL
jgi:hypothetical protein